MGAREGSSQGIRWVNFTNRDDMVGGGTYSPPAARLTSDGPWELTNGVRFAESKAGLARPLTGLNVDQQGNYVDGNYVQAWTGGLSDSTGTTAASSTCGNWTRDGFSTGASGWVLDVTLWSVNSAGEDCGLAQYLYCFED